MVLNLLFPIWFCLVFTIRMCILIWFAYATFASPVPVGKRISYSWSAEYRISTNGSHDTIHESAHKVVATGTDINGTLNADDVFPELRRERYFESRNNSHKRIRRGAKDTSNIDEQLSRFKADRNKKDNDQKGEDMEDEDEFEISPEMKVKIYSGIILGTVFLIVFLMCIWPLFKCCRTCCRVGTTGCLACWDVMNCRDPGYRLMCLAAKQAGLDPPTPEEYDNFMSGWEDKAPELMQALMK